MSFELYIPNRNKGRATNAGQTTIAKSGMARFHVSDLSKARLAGLAAVLLDSSTKRIALRPPRDVADEGLTEPAVVVRWTKGGGIGRVILRGALRKLGLNPADVAAAGPREVMHKDGMLIVGFTEFAEAGHRPRRRTKAKT